MLTIRHGALALAISLLLVLTYRAGALALVDAGVPPLLLALSIAAGMATFAATLSRRWSSPHPGGWALFGAALGLYALPVLLFQAARAHPAR